MGSPNGTVTEDKQYIFYSLKLMELAYFRDTKLRHELNGRPTFKTWVIETVSESKYFESLMTLAEVRQYSFWDLYYRHNNYWIEKNFVFFQHYKLREEIRAASLASLLNIWTCCVHDDLKPAFENMLELRKKFKLSREVPEYALQEAEDRICLLLDARSSKEEVSQLKAKYWHRVTEFLTAEEKLELAKSCKSLYQDLRHKAIGDELISNPKLNQATTPLREQLWLALIPKVSFYLS